jgi:hypothetical protein
MKAQTRTKWAYLMLIKDGHLDRCIASNHYGDCGLTHMNKWAWVVGNLINETGCNPDSVHCVETDEGDKITIDGKVAAYLIEE